jgi:hypothetical protein
MTWDRLFARTVPVAGLLLMRWVELLRAVAIVQETTWGGLFARTVPVAGLLLMEWDELSQVVASV